MHPLTGVISARSKANRGLCRSARVTRSSSFNSSPTAGHSCSAVFVCSAIVRSPAMQREYPDRPIVGVGAIVVDGDADAHRVVLVKRGRAPLLGEWSIPGGVLELGETLRQAAEREVL